MDKYEYKLRLEEIKSLNKKGRFQESAQVADTIDWKKAVSYTHLCQHGADAEAFETGIL